MLRLMFICADCVVSAWTWSAVLLVVIRGIRPAKLPALRFLFHELRPFFLPAAALMLVQQTMNHDSLFWRSFTFVCNVANWFYYKDKDDDDRWKRRKAKLAAAVRQVGGRLQVVPAQARP